ncbi:MAG: hypothetical protein ACTSYA_09275, partial [Candidatus Kariarchaeaceae archaeon]
FTSPFQELVFQDHDLYFTNGTFLTEQFTLDTNLSSGWFTPDYLLSFTLLSQGFASFDCDWDTDADFDFFVIPQSSPLLASNDLFFQSLHYYSLATTNHPEVASLSLPSGDYFLVADFFGERSIVETQLTISIRTSLIDPFYHYSFDDFNVSLNSRVIADGNYTIVSSFSTNYNFELFYSQSFEIQNYYPPLLTLLSPSDGDYLKGEVNIDWLVQDDNFFEVDLFFYPTSSSQPYFIATGLRNSSILWDTTKVTDTLHGKIVVIARNALYSTIEEIGVVVDNTPPVISEISHPEGKVNESYYYIESEEEEIELRWEWEVRDMTELIITRVFMNEELAKEINENPNTIIFNYSVNNSLNLYSIQVVSTDVCSNEIKLEINLSIDWISTKEKHNILQITCIISLVLGLSILLFVFIKHKKVNIKNRNNN